MFHLFCFSSFSMFLVKTRLFVPQNKSDELSKKAQKFINLQPVGMTTHQHPLFIQHRWEQEQRENSDF